jgi:enoyl-CoA hydratase
MEFESIRYSVQGHVARITLNRPSRGNRLSFPLLRELDFAFTSSVDDPDVHVMVLDAEGRDFCLGREPEDPEFQPLELSVQDWLASEEKYYINHWRKWRDLPKPILAQVQGQARIGGVGLAEVCDLIYCSDDAEFIDDSITLGAPSGEYFGHPWDLGPRRTKELLFTGDALRAEEARQVGLVSGVFPRARLHEEVTAIAEKIATRDPFLLKLAKYSVNGHQDAQGFRVSQDQAYWMHMLSHARLQADRYGPHTR